MPEKIRARLGVKVAEFHRTSLVQMEGDSFGGYRRGCQQVWLPDVAIFRLKRQRSCRE